MTKHVFPGLMAVILLSSCVTLQERDFFFPDKYDAFSLRQAGIVSAEEITLTAADGAVLRGVNLRYGGATDYLIYFYGNQLSVNESRERLYFLCEKFRINLVCFDYRGYGASRGLPGFDELRNDGVLIYDYVLNNLAKGNGSVFVFSQSLGTVPACEIGAVRKPAGIIMEAPFTTAGEAVPLLTEGLAWPFKHMISLSPAEVLTTKTGQPADNIKKFTSPLLILHGVKDEVFPVRLGRKMYELAGSAEKEFVLLDDTGHTDVNIFEGEAYQAVDQFVLTHRKGVDDIK